MEKLVDGFKKSLKKVAPACRRLWHAQWKVLADSRRVLGTLCSCMAARGGGDRGGSGRGRNLAAACGCSRSSAAAFGCNRSWAAAYGCSRSHLGKERNFELRKQKAL